MKENEHIKKCLHFTMAFTGGFLGAYSLLNYHDLFGNAQTSNLIYLVGSAINRDAIQFILRFLDLFVYVSGLAATVFIPKYTKCNIQVLSVVFNCIAGILLCLYPAGINDYIALCPILFAMAFQWNSFSGAEGFTSSTIFSTNNLRQFVTSLSQYKTDKDPKMLKKAKFFGGTLLCYHFGVAVSFMAFLLFQKKAGWICIFPSMLALYELNLLNNWVSVPSFGYQTKIELKPDVVYSETQKRNNIAS